MSITSFQFNPTDGWNNTTTFPTDFSSENATRAAFQLLFNQIRDYLNNTQNAQLSGSGATSGADLIGARAIFEDDASAANVMAKLLYLREQIENMVMGQIPDATITTEKLAAGSVTATKIADASVSNAKLSVALQTLLSELNNSFSRLTAMEYNQLQLYLRNYYDGKTLQKKGMFYDGFADTSTIDSSETPAYMDTANGKLMTFTRFAPNRPASVYQSAIASNGEANNYMDRIALTFVAQEGHTTVSRITIRAANQLSSGISSISAALYDTDADGKPSSSITAIGGVVTITSTDFSEYSFAFSSPVTLTVGKRYAVVIFSNSTNATYIQNTTVQSSEAYDFKTATYLHAIGYYTWSIYSTFALNISFDNLPSNVSYQTVEQNLQEDADAARVYIRKSSGSGFTATPQIALYESGSATFADMAQDTEYVSPTFSGSTDVEEKWTAEGLATGSKAKVKLTLTGGTYTDYVKSYGVIAVMK